MSRSAVREIQVSGITARRGEVVVPSQIGDPVHGMLSCHAAQLVAGSLRAKGREVRFAELPSCDDPAGEVRALGLGPGEPLILGENARTLLGIATSA